MSLIVIGLSHHSAPLAVLESLSQRAARANEIAASVLASAAATEVLVLSTCNRLEVYAQVPAFHPAVTAIGRALAVAAGAPAVPDAAPSRPAGSALGNAAALDSASDTDIGTTVEVEPGDELAHFAEALAEHLYVRFEEAAVRHAFTVACGLDSMAVGEAQILGQIREALSSAQASGAAGQSLNSLFQQALRVGKRAHSETDIDQHSVSLVQMALEQAQQVVGPLDDQRATVVGAGGMSGLAAAATSRAGVASLTIVGRTPDRAARLAAATGGHTRPWSDLTAVVAESDIVITCTGAMGHLITGADLATGSVRRGGRPQVVIDLALPRDVEPPDTWTHPVPRVTVLDLQGLGRLLEGRTDSAVVAHVRAMVDGEVAAFQTRLVEQSVGPTVAALRARAAALVAAEMARLDQRLPDLDDTSRSEVGLAVHRIVEKLLHTPTVRMKEFAMEEGGADYAAALRELFDLEPTQVANVSTPPLRGAS